MNAYWLGLFAANLASLGISIFAVYKDGDLGIYGACIPLEIGVAVYCFMKARE
jgi:hypothetical protein